MIAIIIMICQHLIYTAIPNFPARLSIVVDTQVFKDDDDDDDDDEYDDNVDEDDTRVSKDDDHFWRQLFVMVIRTVIIITW